MIGPYRILSSCIIIILTVLAAATALAGTSGRIDCDIQRSACVMLSDSGMQVVFDVIPRPVKAMQELEYIVTLTVRGRPVSGASLLLDLSMPGMFMGNNQPKLNEEQGGRYRGRGVIPACSTGTKTWKALIAIAHGGQIEKVTFQFEVK